MSLSVLKIRVSFKGRPLKSYSFTKESITIGRDPDAEVFLDNTGVSREHARIDREGGGWSIEDTGSANGTFLNEGQIRRHSLANNDVVRIGKFSLWITITVDQRGSDTHKDRKVAPDAMAGTTVLTSDQLARVLDSARETEQEPPPLELVPARGYASPPALIGHTTQFVVWVAIGTFLAGACIGAGALAFWLR